MQMKRVRAVMRARFREYYRDTASWVWNLVMPLMLVVVFAFIFSEDSREMFKVGLHAADGETADLKFTATRHIEFIDVVDL